MIYLKWCQNKEQDRILEVAEGGEIAQLEAAQMNREKNMSVPGHRFVNFISYGGEFVRADKSVLSMNRAEEVIAGEMEQKGGQRLLLGRDGEGPRQNV